MNIKIITNEIMNMFYEKNSCLYWKTQNGRRGIKDTLAGGLNKSSGYYQVMVNNKTYVVHRILYQFYHNIILTPEDMIDHMNLDKLDNRKENLRLCTQSQNCMNRLAGKNNLSTGIKNISLRTLGSHQYYTLKVTLNRKELSKAFRADKFSLDDVIEIRDKMLEELHKEFYNKGVEL